MEQWYQLICSSVEPIPEPETINYFPVVSEVVTNVYSLRRFSLEPVQLLTKIFFNHFMFLQTKEESLGWKLF